MKKLVLLVFLSASLIGCKNEQPEKNTSAEFSSEKDPIAKEIAMANGFGNFENVNQLNYTFNVKVNDSIVSQRQWKWFPKENKVELTEKGKSFSYNTNGELNEQEKEVDQKFINDKYWLLFPFELVWSEFKGELEPQATAPISKNQMQMLTVKYSDSGGYTPGDTYLVYFDKNEKIIKEWTYRSSTGRSLSTTWEDYENFNGLNIAKMHSSEDGKFQLFFTDIAVN